MRKTKEKKVQEIKYSGCLYNKLSDIVNYFKSEGATEEDFKDIEFEMDYSSCWYESDTPSIVAVFYKKIE